MSIDKIRNIGLDKLVTQVYDFESLTTDELMCKFAQKINIIIEHFNYLDKQCQNNNENVNLKLQYLLGQGLEEQVAKRLLELINNGTLGELINETLLKDINDKVDNFKVEVNEQFDAIENTKTNNSTVENLKQQVDNLVINASGTSNTEVIQARTQGIFTYNTLNDRINVLNDMLNKNEYNGYFAMEKGNITNGEDVASDIALRTGYILNDDSTVIKNFKIVHGYQYKIVMYDSNKTFLEETNIATWEIDRVITSYYYRIVLQRTDTSSINLTENTNVYLYKKYDNFVNFKTEYNNFVKSYNNRKIKTVKDYGAKGDGVTDDWQSITNAIADCGTNEMLLFPYGTYLISKTLKITKSLRINLCGSTIKCNNDIGTLLQFCSDDTTLIRDLVLEHGTIDVGQIAWRGIMITDLAHFTIRNITINGFRSDGIRIGRGGLTKQCYEGFFEDIRLVGPSENAITNTFGIYVDTSDCHFNNIIGTGGMNAVIVNGWEGNFYSRVHGWFDYPSSSRCLIKVYDECFINQCYSDSLPIGIQLVGSKAHAKISQCRFLYPSKNENSTEYYAVKFDEDVATPKNTSLVQCTFYGVGNNEYNFDTNKDIEIILSTYTNANKKFNS